MAPRKAKTTAVAPREHPAAPATGRRINRRDVQPAVVDHNRLLREAAWSRMFGRVESKNPFAR